MTTRDQFVMVGADSQYAANLGLDARIALYRRVIGCLRADGMRDSTAKQRQLIYYARAEAAAILRLKAAMTTNELIVQLVQLLDEALGLQAARAEGFV